MKKINSRGIISLEACIVIPLFIFIMLWIYSFFIIFYTHNVISNALVQTSESLSLDPYATEGLNLSSGNELTDIYDIFTKAYNNMYKSEFFDSNVWYNNADINEVVEKRFYAMLGGKDTAKSKFIAMKVKDASLDFSDSRVENGKIYVKVNYKINYLFDVFNFGEVVIKQEACSKLWTYK